jgi:hypothetical protein
MPFMLLRVPPTERRARIPTVVVMGFQLGLLEPNGLPFAGAEQADRLLELAG